MSIRPLADRVVVRQLEAESTSSGGIILPGSAAEKPNQGEICFRWSWFGQVLVYTV